VYEDRLCHLLSPVLVAFDQTERGGKNQIHVASHKFAKGGIRSALDVFGEPILVVRHVQSPVKGHRVIKPNKIFSTFLNAATGRC
jgi:hypothetical protein